MPKSTPVSGFTVTLPADLLAAIDRRVGIPEDADGDTRRERREYWLLEQCLRNDLRNELAASAQEASDTLAERLAALPEGKRAEIEVLIGQPLPAPPTKAQPSKADDAPIDISK
jgi:hypothetical protein